MAFSLKKKGQETEGVQNAEAQDGANQTASASASTESTQTSTKKKKKDDYSYIIKNKRVRTEAKHRKAITIATIIIIILLLISAIVTAIFMLAEQMRFNVFVDNGGSKVMSLSHTSDLANPTEMLELTTPGSLDNTTLAKGFSQVNTPTIEELLEEIVNGDGMQSTSDDKHIASSFYLINNTDEYQPYVEFLNIKNDVNNLASAMRVMIVRNGEIEIYAQATSSGEAEKAVPLQNNVYSELKLTVSTTPDGTNRYVLTEPTDGNAENEPWYATKFHSEDYVFYNTDKVLAPGEVVKYSVIIWLEGNDPDCTNEKLQSTIYLDLGFEQVTPTVND